MATNDGVYRYDGGSFSNITGKVSSARFSSILEDRKGIFGSLLLVLVFFIMMPAWMTESGRGNPFEILQPGMGLPITALFVFMKMAPAIFGSVQQTEHAVTMGNPFEILK